MRIQSINNTNFRGLFTDKSAQNGGNWLMEYSPYSWENNNTSKMASKQRVDVYASSLPDNEEIYSRFGDGGENSKDILGTESYYKTSDGRMRRTITEVPSMNREESLKVQNKKYDLFLDMKNNEYKRLKSNVRSVPQDIDYAKTMYNHYAQNIPFGIFTGDSTQNRTAEGMRKGFNHLRDTAEKTYHSFQLYDELRESADSIRTKKAANAKEIELLANARKNGKLIDISRRDIDGASNVLKEALQSVREAAGRIVALPHKTVTLDSILKEIGSKVKSADIPSEAVKYVENLIKKGI